MLSNTEKEYMEHAIGLDYRKPRWRRGYRYYYPYRNYFGIGSNNDPTWEGLVEKGFAGTNNHSTYWVTNEGLHELSMELDMHIYSENHNCVGDAKGPVLRALIDRAAIIGPDSTFPMSSRLIAQKTRIPVNMVRETLRFLSEQGLVTKTYNGGCDEEGNPYCHHGWGITEKATETDYYKEAESREMDKVQKLLYKGGAR